MRRYLLALAIAIAAACTWPGSGITHPAPVHAAALGDTLHAGSCMYGGDYLLSGNIAYSFSQQTDGNLVEYLLSENYAMWNTGAHSGNQHVTCLQTNGNVTQMQAVNGQWVLGWQSNTAGPNTGQYHMTLQSDGNLVVYTNSGGFVWQNNEYAKPNALQNMTAVWQQRPYPASQLSQTNYQGWFQGCGTDPNSLPLDGFYTLAEASPCAPLPIFSHNPGWYFVGHDADAIFRPFHAANVGDDLWFWEPNGTLHVWRITHIRNDVAVSNPDGSYPYSDSAVQFQTCMDYSQNYDEIVDARVLP